MFTNYILKNDILYLEINVNYEFSSDNHNNKTFIEQIKDFININKLNNKFKKIIITCSGFIIGTIIFFNNNTNDEIKFKYIPDFKNSTTYIAKYNNEDKNDVISNINNEDKNQENIQNKVKNNAKKDDIEQINNIKNEEIQQNDNTLKEVNEPIQNVSNEPKIDIHRSNGSVINITLNDYLIGVLAAEMPASFNIEALKAQAVASRTYALKAKASGKILTDTVSTQSYIDENQMRNKWGSSFDTYYNKIKNAVESTDGEYLSYNGNYIEALYHSTNNGKTESSLDVFGNYYPYLISVSSEFDKSASSYLRTTNIDFNTMSSKLGLNFNNESIIQVLSYTDGGNIKEINIDGKTFTGRQFRELLGLRSADFDINIDNNTTSITTRGFGHGVGLSQYGSNGMANAGYSYRDILSHYYPNTQLKK